MKLRSQLSMDIHGVMVTLVMVDQFTALDNDYAANMRRDNLHTNSKGNDTMACQWFKAIASVADDEVPMKRKDYK